MCAYGWRIPVSTNKSAQRVEGRQKWVEQGKESMGRVKEAGRRADRNWKGSSMAAMHDKILSSIPVLIPCPRSMRAWPSDTSDLHVQVDPMGGKGLCFGKGTNVLMQKSPLVRWVSC